MMGTNPLTFSLPTDEEFPFCIDCATSVVQRGKKDEHEVDLLYVTHTATEKAIRDALVDIAKLEDVLQKEPSLIRVED